MLKSNILIVDDDTRIRNLLGEYLKDNNFDVDFAKDTQEARKEMDSKNFDLVILDVMMPGESGIEYMKSVREESNIPIIILTAMGESDDKIIGLEAGASDYLTKPFEPRELLLRIKNILNR